MQISELNILPKSRLWFGLFTWKENVLSILQKNKTSITIGIKEWLAPQISEHWPYITPLFRILNIIVFRRPGTESIFTAILGTAQQWSTSAEVVII